MRIDTLHLTNFKLFESLEVQLNPQFNVIIGENGKGKTALCDAIAIAAGGFLQGIPTAPKRTISVDEKRGAFHEGVWEDEILCKVEASGEVVGHSLTWYRSIQKKATNSNTTVGLKTIAHLAESAANRSLHDHPATLPVFAYLGTGRLWQQRRGPYKGKQLTRFRGYAECLDPSGNLREIVDWWRRLAGAKSDQEIYQRHLRAVQKAIATCIGFRDIEYDPSKEDLIGTLEEENGTKKRLFFRMLSDGQRNLVGMVADIAYRAAQLNPHLKEEAAIKTPGIVIIDELELHLHPRWQRSVVQRLKEAFPHVQFVATTHAPFIIQSLKSDEVLDLAHCQQDAQGNTVLKPGGEAYFKKGIEDIAEIMGVEEPVRSERFQEMVEKAKEYYSLVDEAATSGNGKVEEIKKQLDALVAHYSDDPAFVARLEIKRASELG